MAKGVVTYSPAFTLVPTYGCFNHCEYCNFREDPQRAEFLSLTQAREVLEGLQRRMDGVAVREILILSGEVHWRSPRRREWFQRIFDLGQLALGLGFFPHTNAGILQREEMAALGEVNFSLGLMVEQVTPRLLRTVHRRSPSKEPGLRLQQLRWAGELGIPYTTGILVGLGETPEDRLESLRAIAQIQERHGHIQEVIIQPHSLGSVQDWRLPSFELGELPELVALARGILPPEVVIQVPPNLIQRSQILWDCLDAGARDLGGIGPRDEVNPDYGHLDSGQLTTRLGEQGWQLVPRFPVYPRHYSWLPPSLQRKLPGHSSGTTR